MKSSQAPNETEENGEPAPVRRRQEGTGYSDDEVIPLPVVHQTGTGEKRLLRVKWEDYADSAHLWTTLGVYVLWPLHPLCSCYFPFFFDVISALAELHVTLVVPLASRTPTHSIPD